MAYLSSGPQTESRRRKPFPIERRPQMLKDYLMDDMSSCSSNGFRSYPRHASCESVRNLVQMDLKARDSNLSTKVLKSRSKAASKTIFVFHKVINVVKHLPFSSIKAPSQPKSQTKQGIFPRSLSRRLRRSFWKKRDIVENYDIKEIKVRVMIKDIIRWKSFRDLIEEKQQQPLDFSPSRLHICSIAPAPADADAAAADVDATTITTSSSISTIDSKSHSWSDSDFTSEYLQSSGGSSEYSGENEDDQEGKECSPEKKMPSNGVHKAIHEDSMETTTNSVDPKKQGECRYEEKEQFSPVSVLDFPEEEDDEETETSSSFHQSIANMERTKHKLMQKIRRFESLAQLEPVDLEKRITLLEKDDDSGESPSHYDLSQEGEDEQESEVDLEAKIVEERAIELLNIIKATNSLTTGNLDGVLLDFFKERIIGRSNTEGEGFDYEEVVKVARDWVSEKTYGGMTLGLEYDREVYVRDMESEGRRWRKFEEEQSEVAAEIERGVLGFLINELLVDLSRN